MKTKQIYWKDNCHFYKIIKKNCVIAIGYAFIALEDYSSLPKHYLFDFIKEKKVTKSTKTEFLTAHKEATKNIDIK